MEYNYTAIVLKKKKIGETDRLYTFYTLEAGKMQAIGKGARKPKAKLAGHLETLNFLDMIVARRHGLGNIASAVAEGYFLALKSNPETLRKVFSMLGYFERLIDFEEKDEILFLILKDYLTLADSLSLEQKKEKVDMVTQGFLFKALERLGYRFELYACAVSGLSLERGRRYYFSPDVGGIVDARHIRWAKQAIPVSENAIKMMRLFAKNSLVAISRLAVNREDLLQVERASAAFMEWNFHS